MYKNYSSRAAQVSYCWRWMVMMMQLFFYFIVINVMFHLSSTSVVYIYIKFFCLLVYFNVPDAVVIMCKLLSRISHCPRSSLLLSSPLVQMLLRRLRSVHLTY